MSSSSTPRPLAPPPPTGDGRLDALATLLAIVDRLRDDAIDSVRFDVD